METRCRCFDKDRSASSFCFAGGEGLACRITGSIACGKGFTSGENFTGCESSGNNEPPGTEDHTVRLGIK
jgi:hypothetical protein